MDEYIGPNYPYHQNISMPEEMEMSVGGDIDSIGRNLNGLINYGKLLTFGSGRANKKIDNEQDNLGEKQPIGDRIFIKTMGDCNPVGRDGNYIDDKFEPLADGKPITVDRQALIDHIPTGNIPDMGNLSAMKGFIPGLMDNIFKMNPTKIFTAMTADAIPKCYKLKFQTIKFNNKNPDATKHDIAYEEAWVSIDDLKDLNSCTFKPGKLGPASINGVPIPSMVMPGGNYKHPVDQSNIFKQVSCTWVEIPEVPTDGFTNLFKMKKNLKLKNQLLM